MSADQAVTTGTPDTGDSVVAAAGAGIARLVAVRVGGHTTFDRLVFEFAGQAPGATVRYVAQVLGDGSGQPIPLRGRAFLEVAMTPADAHDGTGASTLGPLPTITGLAALRDLAPAGDFEAHVTFGVGVADTLLFDAFGLGGPSRIVVDVQHAPPGTGNTLLRRGSHGAAVATWQWRLNLARHAGLAVDEDFGPATEAATKDFQRASGLAVDGLVGPLTRRAMEHALGL